MTGVADPRVAAIVPIVIDVLNVESSMRHHAAVYGFWAESIGDYVRHGIMTRWGHPRLQGIYEIVDPYYHRDRLTIPKFIVNACGDQFFCPDSSQFYFADLQGEKHLRYVPNADHSLRDSDAVESIAAFYQMVLAGKARPRFAWTFEPDGSIRVETKDRPARVLLWQATNPQARDFRLKTIGPAFTSRQLNGEGNGVFVGRIKPPGKGWTAFLVELSYDTGTPLPLKLTTAVRILPETLPHAGIDPAKTPYEPDATGSR
jgi:PhoPQ-activated pathogenicity-related protein